MRLKMETFLLVCEQLMFDNNVEILQLIMVSENRQMNFVKLRENHFRAPIDDDQWLDQYNEVVFFQLFRMKKETYVKLLDVVLENDTFRLIKKQFRGGKYPVTPEKSLLVFLWYIATEDTLISMTETFKIVQSTIHQIINAVLYIVVNLKKKYIFWPQSEEELTHITNGFRHYPYTLGALDGSHIDIKVVPNTQQDSYVDRHLRHSINAMVICNAEKILTYAFIGFPGSAHDSRVFTHSSFVQNIERYGSQIYFPTEDHHIIGDSAFPIKTWLMTPYSRNQQLNRLQRNHNNHLSADRVCVENIFALIKGRFRRLIYINTYSISKCIEIATAACVVHNFCYLNKDEWDEDLYYLDDNQPEYEEQLNIDNAEATRRGKAKRDRIARLLYQQQIVINE